MLFLNVLDATPSSTAPAPSAGLGEDVGGAADRGVDGEEGLDLTSANAIIQQQQNQIQALLQQQQQLQLQAQASTLFAPTSNLLTTDVQVGRAKWVWLAISFGDFFL